jgi:hypothetical protein
MKKDSMGRIRENQRWECRNCNAVSLEPQPVPHNAEENRKETTPKMTGEYWKNDEKDQPYFDAADKPTWHKEIK